MTAARRATARREGANAKRRSAARGASPPPPAERADVCARVTDAVVAAIEGGAARGKDWRMPWHRRRDPTGSPALPTNVARGAAYRGANALALWAAAEARGHPGGLWGTYRQWGELGGQVRKGERAATVVFWRFPERAEVGGGGAAEGQDHGDDDAEGARRGGPWARAYAVFNAAQVDGATLPAKPRPALPEAARIAAAERFFAALPGLDLRHGSNAAFYSPDADRVHMPPFADFRDAGGYYATLAHECAHWTGHPSRLARDLSARFGSGAYAAEELVAELGAAFALAALGLSAEPREDHARYVAQWLALLRGDRRAIFAAAGKAQGAADWLLERAAPAGNTRPPKASG